jgi:hypothetical protein
VQGIDDVVNEIATEALEQQAERDLPLLERIAKLEAENARLTGERDDARQHCTCLENEVQKLSDSIDAEGKRWNAKLCEALAQRDDARRDCIAEWSARFSEFGFGPKRHQADKLWGPGEGKRLFPETKDPDPARRT